VVHRVGRELLVELLDDLDGGQLLARGLRLLLDPRGLVARVGLAVVGGSLAASTPSIDL
jgi:hypothetical protein